MSSLALITVTGISESEGDEEPRFYIMASYCPYAPVCMYIYSFAVTFTKRPWVIGKVALHTHAQAVASVFLWMVREPHAETFPPLTHTALNKQLMALPDETTLSQLLCHVELARTFCGDQWSASR